jgi:hypothetical protein
LPDALRTLTRDGWLVFLTRFVRLFAYGSLSVVLVFYLIRLGLSESQTGLLLTLTLVGDTIVSSITPSPTTFSPTTPVETKPATPNMVGGWQVHGNFQNRAPYAGQIEFAANSYFQMGAQGITTASGSWRWESASRNLVLDGQHNLYGYPLQFRCVLGGASQDRDVWSGQCQDQTGVGTIQLSR